MRRYSGSQSDYRWHREPGSIQFRNGPDTVYATTSSHHAESTVWKTEVPLRGDYTLPSILEPAETCRPTLRFRSRGATAIPELNKSPFGRTKYIAAGDQKMVHYTYIDEIQGTFQSLGNQFVRGTEPIILAGMIMN